MVYNKIQPKKQADFEKIQGKKQVKIKNLTLKWNFVHNFYIIFQV